MKKDIENRTDIELLVNTFYERVEADDQLGFIFNQVAHVNWSVHLPAMYRFWENILLLTGTYEGNPMNLHKHLHHLAPLNAAHFDQWILLFTNTVEDLFEGKIASRAKQHATSIATIMCTQIVEVKKN